VPLVAAPPIGTLLRVVHAEQVSDLVNHVANVENAVAPAQVDISASAVSRKAEATHIATVGVEDADLRARQRRAGGLHEDHTGRVSPPPGRLPEGFLSASVQVRGEVVVDRDILFPHVRIHGHGHIGNPVRPRRCRSTVRAARAIPQPARCRRGHLVSLCIQKLCLVGSLIPNWQISVFRFLVSAEPSHRNRIHISQVVLVEVKLVCRHAETFQMTCVSIHLERL